MKTTTNWVVMVGAADIHAASWNDAQKIRAEYRKAGVRAVVVRK